MSGIPDKCVVRHMILPPFQIHYLRFILEAYEGIGIVTTLDPRLGLIQLRIAPGCEEEIDRILEAEKEQLQWRGVALEEDFPSQLLFEEICILEPFSSNRTPQTKASSASSP
ncbi:DUF4911 domain-containing protein [Desulforhabdus amnigena]|uniref:DUF4911 domain-containing protein n=1 Tax=Desulforhabdus amnigena TaxID=40218 RepID=A0A9W6D3Z8_9BACT|nr:DUF4911 domain-containing protein [Desulforhabdus amnigena]NLJ27048.1 DUF4911 domain-containing protein [Deltaproteobacteria bacterium]GLI34148.1 hypothetical protein DAMNIGENAA_15810 [Desulforhabdus amnigena]